MSTITNIGLCKKNMSQAGWSLFCEHKKRDTLSPFSPEEAADSEEIMLSRVEVLQYEYGHAVPRNK